MSDDEGVWALGSVAQHQFMQVPGYREADTYCFPGDKHAEEYGKDLQWRGFHQDLIIYHTYEAKWNDCEELPEPMRARCSGDPRFVRLLPHAVVMKPKALIVCNPCMNKEGKFVPYWDGGVELPIFHS